MKRVLAAGSAVALCLANGAIAGGPERPDTISLGRSAAGEPCAATRDWHDPAVPDPFARSYALTCRGVAASRPVGAIRIVSARPEAMRPIERTLDCGPPQAVIVAKRAAQARRCYDRQLSTRTIRLDLPFDREVLIADAAPALLGELEEGVAILTGAKPASADSARAVVASFDPASLKPAPGEADPAGNGGTATVIDGLASLDASNFNPAAALADGVSLNHKGLNVEASRVLNDALSRITPASDPAVHAELLLEAGLADSNIHFAEAASDHFAQAEALMKDHASARSSLLQRKHDSYLALDAISRRQFTQALAMLDRLARAPASAEQPLQDPATLRLLNQPRSTAGSAVSSIAVPNTADLTRVVLDVQVAWARSVALASLGDAAGAMTAIDAAAAAYRPLATERISRAEILWLGARIERQRGRLLARRGQIGPALASFDRAVDDLRRGALASGGTGGEPAIAEAQLERASLFARSGARRDEIRDDYARAIDALIASSDNPLGAASGMEDYLDLLVAEASDHPRPDTFERFFRAIQATGEPAVARQLSQLQNVVGTDPELAAAVRERATLEREITRLRYTITAAEAGQPSASDLEKARNAAEQRLLAINAVLARNPRFRAVDERPATLAELTAALRPGEAYLKLAETGRRIYGMIVSADATHVYAVAPTIEAREAVDRLAGDVRSSIDGRLGSGELVPFDDAGAYALFRLIGGPASAALAQARALVVDPSGPLERLPLGVLVTRYDRNAQRPSAFDFSQTAFLAATTTISTALSPRSFLVARALPPSRARHAFLGLGEHVPPPEGTGDGARMVQVGYGCEVRYDQLTALSRQIGPISRSELTIAADALGDPGAPMMTDASFSDTGVEERSDLSQYEVLHFATHGLQEGQWGCAKSPPALVTSFGTGASDGLLSFSEIAGLRLDANLVVLSACDTASGISGEDVARLAGQEEAGSTLQGLVRAFLTANARAVLATYWQVSAEKDNQEFIRAFYTSARDKPIGAALQDAQRDLMGQPTFSHPFYWAPYFVVGDSTKTALTTAPTTVLPQRVAQR